ncbi:MAG: FtsQ-type POTRA domain-containing protein [Smithella sp.]
MARRFRTKLSAKKHRLRRRLANGLGEFAAASVLLLSITVLCLLFIYSFCYVLSMPYFEVKEISVRGLKELTEKDILTQAAIQQRQNLLAVNIETVKKRISANPWVKNIYVGRELPNRLILEVQERSAAAMVKQAGDFYLVDNEGVIFKKLGKGDEVDLPILTGINSKEGEKSKFLPGALSLLKTMSASNRYNNLGSISEVNIDDVFGISLLTDTGLYLKLGTDNYENKLNQLNVVLVDVEKRGLRKGFIFVDLCDITKITIQHKNVSEQQPQPESSKKGQQYRT